MDLKELKRRRIALANEMQRNSVAILSSASKNFRTKDVENPYRQHSDFLYLAGLNEPNLINIVFMENDDHKKTWNNFTKFVLWGTVAVIAVLVLMAIFLL